MKVPPILLASSFKRCLAALLDFIFFSLFLRFSLIPFTVLQDWDIRDQVDWRYYFVFYPLLLALLFLRDSFGGASPGRRLLNIKVCLIQDGLPTPGCVLLLKRNLFLLLPTEIYYLLFDVKHRRLGDKRTGTAVIVAKHSFSVRDFSTRVVGLFFALSMLWSIYAYTSGYQIEKSRLYAQSLVELQRDAAAQQRLGDIIQIDSPQMYFENGKYALVLEVQGSQGESQISFYFTRSKNETSYRFVELLFE